VKALEQAIWQRLTGDATLMAVITGIYNVAAPERAVYPFAIFQLVAANDSYTFRKRVATQYLYQLRIAGEGLDKEPLLDALERADVLLTLQVFNLGGAKAARIVRETRLPDMSDMVEGKMYVQVGSSYRIWVRKEGA